MSPEEQLAFAVLVSGIKDASERPTRGLHVRRWAAAVRSMGERGPLACLSFVSLCELFCFEAIRRRVLKGHARLKTSRRLVADRGHGKGLLRVRIRRFGHRRYRLWAIRKLES